MEFSKHTQKYNEPPYTQLPVSTTIIIFVFNVWSLTSTFFEYFKEHSRHHIIPLSTQGFKNKFQGWAKLLNKKESFLCLRVRGQCVWLQLLWSQSRKNLSVHPKENRTEKGSGIWNILPEILCLFFVKYTYVWGELMQPFSRSVPSFNWRFLLLHQDLGKRWKPWLSSFYVLNWHTFPSYWTNDNFTF